ncbi:BTB/POZ domain-containing protein 9-like [Drosophila miranda]|uniref:BTB/POZ domain-containing protein 9-like n=1 Tax=Drosophila miranda TaxID=7229 RepID=UPI00143F1A14|nr:BTB/POZ domain-containing protein 9-like [Drosophila miranda]XP_033249307.1 BTB/POZ domain-containing protein 9-like [Drosophila miranda]XP_033249308.1 BTB/POZ domain-containing protein 9-like [Drosophila miranda]XP_033249309.1 BTB/POZ domain-containing protein 9-like [Drosophila miranda]XP_033249310.1 BTB/POZ domain-containing protein 9-like [Drosophila miranda]
MSSQENQRTIVENIDEIDSFVADMASLCMNEPYSDVEFLVEDQRLPGHRLVLATRSEYFRALLYGGLAESNQRDVPLEVPLEAFKLILGYLYSGKMHLSTLDVDTIIDVLDLAHLYGLQAVETGVDKYLQQNLSVSNVCTILDVARRKNLNQRAEECLNFIDYNSSDIVKHDSFEKLSKELIEELLRRDKFAALEIDIFRAVCKWRDNHPSEDFKTVAALVRLPLMTIQQLVQEVRPSGLFEPDQVFNAIGQVDTGENLPYRFVVLPGEGVASGKHLARRFQDEQNRIVFELRNLSAINFIEVIFKYTPYNRNIMIEVDVSCEQTHWDRLESKSCLENMTQNFNFKERPVRYIRLEAVPSASIHSVDSLTAMYKK